MIEYCLAACRAAMRIFARMHGSCRTFRAVLTATVILIMIPAMANAGLRKPDGTPLKQFGFATGPEMNTPDEVRRNYDAILRITGPGGLIRTGLAWDPTKSNVPDFKVWNTLKLEPAIARGLIILPRIATGGVGGYKIPTDLQWTTGLRAIVRMYGPGGTYQKGGSYVRSGTKVYVSAHSAFRGYTDFELWNEPDSQGNVGGLMTPARTAHMLKIGAIAMRDEASKMGFAINIAGPGYDGVEVADISKLWNADNSIFAYIDTLTVHPYSRLSVLDCDPVKDKVRCLKTFADVRAFLDSHGGTRVHLGATEGSYAGAAGTCLGPQVLTEQMQSVRSEEVLNWVRARPWLDLDFWLTYHPVDRAVSYAFNCDSGIYDNNFYKYKLGVIRPDLTLKPWGLRYHNLINSWR